MKRLIFLLFPFLVLIAVVLAVAIGESRLPPAWQGELETYITGQSETSSVVMRVEAAVRASKPWFFNQEMIKGSPYKELAFPPPEVWCILLEQSPLMTGKDITVSPYTIVFAVRHEEIYYTHWVIYEGANDPAIATFQEKMTRIGCDLRLEPVRLSKFSAEE